MDYRTLYNSITVRGNETRETKLNPDCYLSIAAEVNERFAEEIANQFSVEYVQQSCIAISDESQKAALEEVHDILAQYMDVGNIRRPMTSDERHEWLFTFYSEL